MLGLNNFKGFEEDDVIAHLLDSLQVNGILQDLSFRFGSPFSSRSKAAIEAQLARNCEVGEHIKKLKKSQSKEKVSPTTSRLFICGEPYAGKSMLALSLAKSAQSKSRYCTCFVGDHMSTKRTRGIEITSLSENNINISMWDLAGQPEFHSLHDHMFPNFSTQASPSFFLFVWNPFEMTPNGYDLRQKKSRQKFSLEFKYWLKFIVSKTRRWNVLKPRLIVVLSRKDRMADGIESWLGNSLTNVKQSFHEFIDIAGIFEVDARDHIQVKDVYSCIFKTADEILRSGVPKVYVQCEQVRTFLSDKLRTKNISPLITFTKFRAWCIKLGIESNDLYEAIALSLNDSGDLLYLKSMNFVVVDMHWFCYKVMGNLIYYSGPTRKDRGGNVEEVFFSLPYLKSLLEREAKSTSNDSICFFNRRKRSSWESIVEGEDLVKLFLGLHLACRKDVDREDSEIFIPASLPASENSESRWRQDIGDVTEKPVVFLGRRLKCQDSDLTFLTPGVFHVLQVVFYNKFEEEKVHVILEKDLISFTFEGVEVLVELCSEGRGDPFIDVLVRSHLNFDSTLKKVHERVIDEIVRICAEPSGVQGVELVQAVLRPSCVRDLGTRNQDVPIADLQKQLEKEVQKGEKLKDIWYSWQDKDKSGDRVMDLLGEATVRNVCESREGQLHSAGYALGFLKDNGVDEAEPSFKRTLSGKEREMIFKRVGNVEGQIKEMCRTLEDIAASIEGLHKQVMPRLEKAMEELATFLKEGEGGRVPRMPVVTAMKEGWGRRVITALVPELHEARLELLCEHRLHPHLVDRQPGLRFATLDEGLLKQALPYANAFLKFAYVAVKATAHVTLGLGDIVPDFTKVLALLADTSDVPPLPQLAIRAVRLDSQATEQWLFSFLSKHNCADLGAHIHETFRLQRVRYPDQRVAWLCDDHYPDGTPYPA